MPLLFLEQGNGNEVELPIGDVREIHLRGLARKVPQLIRIIELLLHLLGVRRLVPPVVAFFEGNALVATLCCCALCR